MQASRFSDGSEDLTDLGPVVLAARPAPAAGSYMVCPCFCPMPAASPMAVAQELYRIAYERAVAASRPPRHERWFLASAN